MTKLHEEIVAVKQVLQECCEQCGQGAVVIAYFKRLKGAVSKEYERNNKEVFNDLISECIEKISINLKENPWLICELDSTFPSESRAIELSKILTKSIVENISKKKNKITFQNIFHAIPKWLPKNDRDLVLGSIIQFLFYLAEYVPVENEI